MIRILKLCNRYLPEGLRLSLLPYYRRIFPGLNNIIFVPDAHCNYNCPYCLWKRFTPDAIVNTVHPYTRWIEFFERIPPSAVVITGGEPLLYKYLGELIEHFPRKHVLSCVVTNLSTHLERLLSIKKNKEFRIMASFHPSMTTQEDFARKLATLKRNGFSNITVNFVAYPQYVKEILQIKRYFERTAGCYFRVDTFKDPCRRYSEEEHHIIERLKTKAIIPKNRTLGYSFDDFRAKRCKGGSKFAVIVPNGNVYSCMEGFYYSEFQPYRDKFNTLDTFYLGNVFEPGFAFLTADKICHSPCAEVCDLELAGVIPLGK